LTGFLLAVGLAACATHVPVPGCSDPRPIGKESNLSFAAGCHDQNGLFTGGSQVLHLLAHKGRLYAATGYWEDAHNIWYGGTDSNAGWGQVLSLSGPNQHWIVDFNLGRQYLRTELLKSVTFTQDTSGRLLPEPENILLAATYDGPERGGVDVFVRDDPTGKWTATALIRGRTGKLGGDNSVRAAMVYRDRVTGREKLFISVGVLGLFTGTFDPSAPGKIVWDSRRDSPSVFGAGTRILAIVEANDSLFYSEGTKIYRRTDGEKPRYQLVLDMTAQADTRVGRALFQSIGGIRGLSAIDGPVPGRKSLIFLWADGGQSQACIHRLDPKPDGSWSDNREACLAQLASKYIGAPVSYAIGAYSSFMPLKDPLTGGTVYIIGMEAKIPGRAFEQRTAHSQRDNNGGFYAGALYALRDARGNWRIGEVGGKFEPGKPELVSVYTYAISPFGGSDVGRIYLGGYDPDHFASTDTAWVASESLADLLNTH
jgi:hypothetical protein